MSFVTLTPWALKSCCTKHLIIYRRNVVTKLLSSCNQITNKNIIIDLVNSGRPNLGDKMCRFLFYSPRGCSCFNSIFPTTSTENYPPSSLAPYFNLELRTNSNNLLAISFLFGSVYSSLMGTILYFCILSLLVIVTHL